MSQCRHVSFSSTIDWRLEDEKSSRRVIRLKRKNVLGPRRDDDLIARKAYDWLMNLTSTDAIGELSKPGKSILKLFFEEVLPDESHIPTAEEGWRLFHSRSQEMSFDDLNEDAKGFLGSASIHLPRPPAASPARSEANSSLTNSMVSEDVHSNQLDAAWEHAVEGAYKIANRKGLDDTELNLCMESTFHTEESQYEVALDTAKRRWQNERVEEDENASTSSIQDAIDEAACNAFSRWASKRNVSQAKMDAMYGKIFKKQ